MTNAVIVGANWKLLRSKAPAGNDPRTKTPIVISTSAAIDGQ
ncbi:unannotated protein [freshwater metagenome]|uniref:Unannotated protein n=1 Tax=freshwater metagenome TaxID=449393 RepID=A0A6J6TJB1_9ZZZZ